MKTQKLKKVYKIIIAMAVVIVIGLFLAAAISGVARGSIIQLILINIGIVLCLIFIVFYVLAAYIRKINAAERDERTNMILEKTPFAVIMYDNDFNPIDCNEIAIKMFECVDKGHFLKICNEPSPEIQRNGENTNTLSRNYFDIAMRDGMSFCPEYQCRRADGTVIDIECTMVRVHYKNTFSVMEYVRDITEQQLAAKKAEEIVNLNQLLMEASAAFIEIWDEDLNFIDCNQQLLDVFGVSSKEEYDRRYEEFIPYFQPCGRPSMELVMEIADNAFNGRVNRFECMRRLPNGEPLPIELNTFTVESGGKKLLVSYNYDLRNITTAKQNERDAYDWAQKVLDAAPVCIEMWDENCEFYDCNQHTIDNLGLTSKEEYNNNYDKYEPEYQPCGMLSEEKTNQLVKETLLNGYAGCEWLSQTPDGEPVPVDMKMVRLERNGKPVVVSFSHDLRPIKAVMEKERELFELNQAILDAAPFIVTMWDENFKPISASKFAKELLGVPGLKNASGVPNTQYFVDNFEDFWPEYQPCGTPSADFVRQQISIVADKGYARFNWQHIDIHGIPTPTEIIAKSFVNKGRDMFLTFTIDTRLIEKAMLNERRAVELTQQYVDNCPMLIALWDEHFNLVEINENFKGIFGLIDKSEFIRRVSDFWPEKQPCGTLSYKKAAEAFEIVMEVGKHHFEWEFVSSSGESMPFEAFGIKIERDGKPHAVCFFHDLRSIKAVAKREQETLQLVQKLLDNSPVFVELWDTESNMIDCSERMYKLLGADSREDFADRFYDFCLPVQPCGTPVKELNNKMNKLAIENGFARTEWAYKLPNGETMLTDTTYISAKHNEKDVVIVYSIDTRPVKAALEAEESNQAKTRFLARMSHEIRTPISAVMGISEVNLRNKKLEPDIEEAFNKIYDSSRMLLGIVNDLLDLSKIESGKMELVQDTYEVVTLVNDAAMLSKVYLKNKAVEFKLEVDENLPTHLFGDVLRIRQIITNLLTNAFKYTEAGTVVFSLNAESADEGKVMLVLAFRDTGIGMSETQRAELKGEYVRFHEQLKPLIGGTGLGIPIIYSLAELMGAEFDMKSEVGQGTNVVIRIPQMVESDVLIGRDVAESLMKFELNKHTSAKDFEFVPEKMPGGKVLVVDDVEINLFVAEAMLAAFGVDVTLCESGKDAVERIVNGEEYDVIFMDHMMPEMDGIEAAKILRGRGYDKPIVALTANAIVGQSEIFMQNGFSGFMSKPIDIKVLNGFLVRFIKGE